MFVDVFTGYGGLIKGLQNRFVRGGKRRLKIRLFIVHAYRTPWIKKESAGLVAHGYPRSC